jgi:ABC-type sugar transport system permease subunit
MSRNKKLAGLQKRKAIAGYIFILPFILGFLIFLVRPIIDSLYMSFCEIQISTEGFKYVYRGIMNYEQALTIDPAYNRMLTEGLTRMAYTTLAIMVFSFFTALLLNQQFKGRAFVRAIFFLPVILSSGVILGLEVDNSLLSNIADLIEQEGTDGSITLVLQEILRTSGVGSDLFDILFEVVDGVYDIAISSGIQIIIFLSGLQTISKSMYEAASIEGCTAWESLWKITFPMISPLFLVNWIYTIIDFSTRTDNELMDKISTATTVSLDYGFAAAMVWIYFIVIIVIIGITSKLISKGVYYYD